MAVLENGYGLVAVWAAVAIDLDELLAVHLKRLANMARRLWLEQR